MRQIVDCYGHFYARFEERERSAGFAMAALTPSHWPGRSPMAWNRDGFECPEYLAGTNPVLGESGP